MSEQFEYDPLPEPTCIRLVSFVPQDDATCPPPMNQGKPLLQLSLCTVDLRDTPHYEALSYTWGSPFPPEHPRSRAYEDRNSQQPIIVNGREHEIGRNLWEFLYQQQQANASLRKEAAEMLAAGLDAYGRTPLMRAVIDGRIDLAEALLAVGAETEAQDKQGKTALHHALRASIRNLGLAELLVYHGADIHARTQEGKTPLDNIKDEVVALITSLTEDIDGKALPRGLRLSAQRPMWIDSISINQKDTAERNKQVAMMSDIYSNAMPVVVWLGMDDERSPPAQEVLLNDNPIAWIRLTEMRYLMPSELSLANTMKKYYSPQEIRDALAMEKLMARTWWSRAWVIQELTLAKRAVIVCGSVTIDQHLTDCILGWLCYIPSLGKENQDSHPIVDTPAIFESARFAGVHGIEALMLADISFKASKYSREREFILKSILSLRKGVLNGSWGRSLSLQNLGRLSWWSQARDPRDKVFALVGVACPDPQDQGIIVDYTIPVEKLFVQYGHLFIQGSPEEIQDLYTTECYAFEPLEGLSYVQDTPNPHPEFQDYKAKLPSWTPNFSAHLTTCRIWSRKFKAASDIPNSPAILSHPDPRILCVSGHIVDSVVATEPAKSKGDVQVSEVLAWLDFIQRLNPSYSGEDSRVDALRQTLTAGRQVQNKEGARKAFRDFITGKLSQTETDSQLESIIAKLRKSSPRDTMPSVKELQKRKRELQKTKQDLQKLVPKHMQVVEGLWGKVQSRLKLEQVLDEQKQRLLKGDQRLNEHMSKHRQMVEGLREEMQRFLKSEQGFEEQKQRLLKLELGLKEQKQGLLKVRQELLNQECDLPEQMQMFQKLLQRFWELLELLEPGQGEVAQGQADLKQMQEFCKRMQEELQLIPPNNGRRGEYDILLRRYNRSRCLFLTKKGYIGLGPLSVQPEDEVWLFANARTPFVLRRPLEESLRREPLGSNSSAAESESRTFIGEAYIHGIMNREAIRKRDFRPVLLV